MRTCSCVKARGTVSRLGPQMHAACRYIRPIPSPASAVNGPIASMAMPRFKIPVDDRLLKALTASSEKLWPGQGRRGLSRLARDAIRRYGRDNDGNARRRVK